MSLLRAPLSNWDVAGTPLSARGIYSGVIPPIVFSLVTAMGGEQRKPSCSTSWASQEVWCGKWGVLTHQPLPLVPV